MRNVFFQVLTFFTPLMHKIEIMKKPIEVAAKIARKMKNTAKKNFLILKIQLILLTLPNRTLQTSSKSSSDAKLGSNLLMLFLASRQPARLKIATQPMQRRKIKISTTMLNHPMTRPERNNTRVYIVISSAKEFP